MRRDVIYCRFMSHRRLRAQRCQALERAKSARARDVMSRTSSAGRFMRH